MPAKRNSTSGFTLLEVTFASGISLLAFGLVVGALFSLALVREANAQRLAAVVQLNDRIEQLSGLSVQEALTLTVASSLAEDAALQTGYDFLDLKGAPLAPEAIAAENAPGLVALRITVKTRTARGRSLTASAVTLVGGGTGAQ